jgi:iron(III)-enterobactin esterase
MVRQTSFLVGLLVAIGACGAPTTEPADEGGSGGPTGVPAAGSGGISSSAGAASGGSAVGIAGTITQAVGGTASGGASPTGSAGTAGAATGGAPQAGGAGGGSGGTGTLDPGTAGDGDFMVGSTYMDSPDLKLKPNAPAGFSVSFTMTSAESNIYKGADFDPPLSFSRSIKVFVPAQYVDGAAAPFMVSSDGFYGGLQTVVQNLADDPSPDHRVPPLVIIGIQNGPNTSGSSERSLEYDTVSDRYWQFVSKEVLPAVLANAQLKAKFPGFKLTTDPNGRGGYGCSSGGPAVMGLAWFGDFNRVFSFSGSFTALQKTVEHPAGAWEYPALIAAAPLRPNLRVFLEVGENDNGFTSDEAGHRNWVLANQHMAAALKAKGNHYRFIQAKGAGHCDDKARNQVMPEGLIWLWRGYVPK